MNHVRHTSLNENSIVISKLSYTDADMRVRSPAFGSGKRQPENGVVILSGGGFSAAAKDLLYRAAATGGWGAITSWLEAEYMISGTIELDPRNDAVKEA
jgi:hypothetical protein